MSLPFAYDLHVTYEWGSTPPGRLRCWKWTMRPAHVPSRRGHPSKKMLFDLGTLDHHLTIGFIDTPNNKYHLELQSETNVD